jgi:hypothetical protein
LRGFAFIQMFIILLLIVPTVAAQNPELTVSATEVDVFNGDETSIDLTIKNGRTFPDSFIISVFPNFWNKVSVFPEKSFVQLAGLESTTVRIFFNALAEAEFGAKAFTITVKSASNEKIVSSVDVTLRVVRRSPVFVLEVTTDKFSYKPEETVTVTTKVSNIGNVPSEKYSLQVSIMKNNQVLKRETNIIELPARSSEDFHTTINLEKYQSPGVYSAVAVLKNELGFTVSSKSANFEVAKISRALARKETSIGFLTATVTEFRVNDGNAPTPLTITVAVPAFVNQFFVPETKPFTSEKVGDNVLYTWYFDSVAPQEEVSIKYSFSVWQLWLFLLLIIAVVWFAFRYVFTPTIVKTYSHYGPLTKEKEITIKLHVKNKSANEVKDLIVRDVAPPIVHVVPKFETLKPEIKETPQGTELVWRFDSLKAGEERILLYKVKPNVDLLGSLKLPAAQIRFVDRKRQRKIVVSREITISSKAK